MRGAWIEMRTGDKEPYAAQSLPVRGAWIEMSLGNTLLMRKASLPVRGAWIEICNMVSLNPHCQVAPRAGSVD